jgi:ParB-like chromosome segregation protein Spo0J
MTSGIEQTWRDSITIHPLADRFPMMSDSELKELAADIEKHGLKEKVLFTKIDGKRVLIDGRNRMAACFLIGQKPEVQLLGGNLEESTIEALIISRNVHRRHLSPEDRAEALRGFIKANPEKSDREIARETKTNHVAVGRTRKKLEATGTVVPVEKRKGGDNRTRKLPAKKKSARKVVAGKVQEQVAEVAPKLQQSARDTPPKTADAPPPEAPDNSSFSVTGSTTATASESAEQQKAKAGDGNTAGVDEFTECCAKVIPTFDAVDITEARGIFDRECGKRAAALRSAALQS